MSAHGHAHANGRGARDSKHGQSYATGMQEGSRPCGREPCVDVVALPARGEASPLFFGLSAPFYGMTTGNQHSESLRGQFEKP